MSGLPTSTGRPRGRPRKIQIPIFPGLQSPRQHQSAGTSQPSPAPSVGVNQPTPDSPHASNRRALSPMRSWNPNMEGPFEQRNAAQLQYARCYSILSQTITQKIASGESGSMVLFDQMLALAAANQKVNKANMAIHEGFTDRVVDRNQKIEKLNQELLEAKVEIVNLNEAMASIHHAAASKKHNGDDYINDDDDEPSEDAPDDDAPGDDESFFPEDPFEDQGNSYGVMSGSPGDYFEMGNGNANMSGAGGPYETGRSFDAPAGVDNNVENQSFQFANCLPDPFTVQSSGPSTNFPLDPALGGTFVPSADPPLDLSSHSFGNVYGNPAGNYPIQSSPDNYEALRNVPVPAKISWESQNQFSNFSSGDAGVPHMKNNQMNMGHMPVVNPAGHGYHDGMLADQYTNNPPRGNAPRIRFAKGDSKRPFVYPNGNPDEKKRQRVKQRCDHCFIQHSRCPQALPGAPCDTCIAAKIECKYTNIGRGTDNLMKSNNSRRKGSDDQGSPRTRRLHGSLGLLPMIPDGGSGKRTEYSG